MKIALGILPPLFFASTISLSAEIDVNGQLQQSYCSKYFGFMSFELENKSDKWILIESVKLSFGGPEIDERVEIVTGEQLVAWHESTRQRLESYGKTTALASWRSPQPLRRGVMIYEEI